jgi:hypothetical protein
MNRIRKSLREIFDLIIPADAIARAKTRVADLCGPICTSILERILQEPVIHVDETNVRMRKEQQGYVWVLTSFDKVYNFYRSSREAAFLHELLGPFKGILISDFYSGYDSLPCGQQKCLVHLIRDIDDDVLRHPFDTELKLLAGNLGRLLRAIVATIDRFGLKKRHLRKHKKAANRFLQAVGNAQYSSKVASKYQTRFQKSSTKLFTFLDHDGVPWNNNNAEHAIKRFVKYRRDADGRFSETTLSEYLTIASVFETCEFNNVNVLRFLLTQETTLDGILGIAGR